MLTRADPLVENTPAKATFEEKGFLRALDWPASLEAFATVKNPSAPAYRRAPPA